VCQSITDLHSTYQLFNPLYNRDDVKCYATIATAWDGLYPDAKRTEQICNMAIQGMENTAPTTQKVVNIDESKISEVGLIDVALPDIKSTIHRLTDLKGKVVMLDFHVFGQKESPARILALRELYNKYHAQGFEIYQVSLDPDEHFWKQQTAALPWVCVRNDGSNETFLTLYNVRTLPEFFLIDRGNNLVSRSQQIKDVEQEIKKLL
jgi:peroxiredoxin